MITFKPNQRRCLFTHLGEFWADLARLKIFRSYTDSNWILGSDMHLLSWMHRPSLWSMQDGLLCLSSCQTSHLDVWPLQAAYCSEKKKIHNNLKITCIANISSIIVNLSLDFHDLAQDQTTQSKLRQRIHTCTKTHQQHLQIDNI